MNLAVFYWLINMISYIGISSSPKGIADLQKNKGRQPLFTWAFLKGPGVILSGPGVEDTLNTSQDLFTTKQKGQFFW